MKTFIFIFLCVQSAFSAVQLNGNNSFLGASGAATNLGGANFTVTCWFRRLTAGATASSGSGGMTFYPLVCKGVAEADGSNLDAAFMMGLNSTSNTFSADYEDASAGGNHPVFGNTVLASNTWYHGAIRFDSNTFKVFLNGVQDATISVTNIPRFDSIQKFGIGAAMTSTGTPSGSWGGLISEVAVWNVALTDSQIFSIAKSRKSGIPLSIQSSRLVGYWPLNDLGDGLTYTKASDRSKNNNPCFGSNSPVARAEQILSQ